MDQFKEEFEEHVLNIIREHIGRYEEELHTFDPYMEEAVLRGQIAALEELRDELGF